MASAWGAAWGSAWGDAWGGATVPAPAAQFYSGGWPLPARIGREERARHVRRQRELLGILPKPVQAAVRATVKKVAQTHQAPLPVLQQELAKRDVSYEPDYIEAVRKLLIVRAAIDRQIEQMKKRQRDDEEALLMLM